MSLRAAVFPAFLNDDAALSHTQLSVGRSTAQTLLLPTMHCSTDSQPVDCFHGSGGQIVPELQKHPGNLFHHSSVGVLVLETAQRVGSGRVGSGLTQHKVHVMS